MIALGLLIAALVLFILAALPWPSPVNTYHPHLVAAGLACLTAAQLAGGR